MPWLLRDDEVLAPVTVADRFGERLRGLLGRAGHDGALLLTRTRSVHTLGMRFPIGVAHCDRDLRVVAVRAEVPPWRVTRPVRGATCVVEAEAGRFAAWRLQPGDRLRLAGSAGAGAVPGDEGGTEQGPGRGAGGPR